MDARQVAVACVGRRSYSRALRGQPLVQELRKRQATRFGELARRYVLLQGAQLGSHFLAGLAIHHAALAARGDGANPKAVGALIDGPFPAATSSHGLLSMALGDATALLHGAGIWRNYWALATAKGL